ncbi:carbon storage regulator CsrA [Effusibacillus consociatus]|uniref:Translational regulator CsrA n=1 Tax=Effusibacillus consociatus TaxID=1117041 RepID=A0ABV9Q178_9BACL
MLVLARKVGERIMIGDSIEISVLDIRGDQVRIGIKAPQDISILRREIYDEICLTNQKAIVSNDSSELLKEFMQKSTLKVKRTEMNSEDEKQSEK